MTIKTVLCQVFVLLLAATFPVRGQDSGTRSRQKYWDEGLLEWSDFLTARRAAASHADAEWLDIDVVWTLKSETIRQGNYSYEHLFSVCSMNPYASWVYEDARTAVGLRYEQVIFDLFELHRRYFQTAYENSPAKDNIDELWDIHFKRAKSAAEQFKKASGYGRDTTVVASYEQMLAGYLSYGEPEPTLPQYKRDAVGWGGQLGYVGEFFLRSADSYLPASAHGLGFGIEIDHSRLSVMADFSLLFAGKQSEAIKYKNLTWETNDRVNAVSLELSAGYSLWENRLLRLTPMAGVGWGIIENYSFSNRYDIENEDIPYQMGGFRLLAGVLFDWKYACRLNLYGYDRSYTEKALRLKCYVAKTNLPTVEKLDNPRPVADSGYSLNVALVWHFAARGLK